ncbi:uncharacterized protein LOC142318387 [Lycorma delicatula]|uniref:uncharacterized protein LOC142318387 n=1 Tax=Lycorma delicatula TaxID=130591 RepID=UPI003F5148F5
MYDILKSVIFIVTSAMCATSLPMIMNGLYSALKRNHLNFTVKANEFLPDGTYVFYNTDPSISLSGLVPQRLGSVRLSDNLFLRLLPHCGCSRCKFFCSCCSQAKMDAFNIDTMVCMKVEYLEKEIGFSYSLIVNDDVKMQRKISVKNPPPVCFLIPTPLPRMKSGACIRIYDVEVDGDERTIQGCIKLSFTLLNSFSSNYDLGCFHLNVKRGEEINHLNEEEYYRFGADLNFLMEKLKDYKINETIFHTNPFFNHNYENVKTDFSNDMVYIDTNNSQIEKINMPTVNEFSTQETPTSATESLLNSIDIDVIPTDTATNLANVSSPLEANDSEIITSTKYLFS